MEYFSITKVPEIKKVNTKQVEVDIYNKDLLSRMPNRSFAIISGDLR